jgi:DNA-binding CsgD family transcriptional regulator
VPSPPEKRILSVVGEVMGMLDLDELCQALVVALREAVPSEYCAMNEVPADVPGAVSLADPPIPASGHQLWVRYGHQNPLVQHFMHTRDGRATRFSDLLTRRELHRLEIYTAIYRELEVEYQIAFMLPSHANRVLGVALSRSRRDFTAAERDLLNLARPYLIQAYRNAVAYSRVSADGARSIAVADVERRGLTRRQAEVMRLVAMGRSDRDAATELGIGLRTAQKHLERAYRRLGVDNRSQAAQVVWDDARG